MTDRITGGEEGDALTPDDEAAVRRMLAEAAGPEPTPHDVATRLDAVLDELLAERSTGSQADEGARVTVLRARRWPRALLAAAAVLVVGYGVGTVVGQGTLSGTDSATTADESVAGSASEESGAQDSAGRGNLDKRELGEEEGGAGSDGALAESPQELDAVSDLGRFPPRVRSERLEVGVRRALVLLDAQQVDGVVLGYGSRDCRPPSDVDKTDWIPVRYDARPAVLVSLPAAGELVEVTIYSCQGTELDRTLVDPQGG